MITLYQIRKIHTLKSILCLSDEKYKKILKSFDVCSSKELTSTEADIVINILEEEVKIFQLKKYDNLIGRDNVMATPLQLRKIEITWKEICNDKSHENVKKTLRTYLKKHFYIYDLKFLTKVRAGKIISVLNKILEQKILKAI